MPQSDTPIVYAVPQKQFPQGTNETPVFRNPKSDGVDLSAYKEKYPTLLHVYRKRFIDHPEDKCFGRREITETGQLSNIVHWYSNGWVLAEAEAFGSGLMALELVPEICEWKNYCMRFLGIYAKNCLEYMLADIGSTVYGITGVPIYDTLGEEATLFAFVQTRMTTCLVSANHVPKILKNKLELGHFPTLKTLIVIDPENLPVEVSNKNQSGLTLISFSDVKTAGRNRILPWAEIKPDDIYTFSYTSGTTAEPKGAMISHSNITSVLVAAHDVIEFSGDNVYFDYLPYAHSMDRVLVNAMHAWNVPIFIFSGDVTKIVEDLGIAKPTLFPSVPRLFNRVYDGMQKKIASQSMFKRGLISFATKSKLQNLHSKTKYTHSIYDRVVFNKMREALGGNVRMMLTGSAPLTSEVNDFLKIAFSTPILEGYGQTEATAFEFITRIDDPISGHVGGPSLVAEFKLVDVPEMNYTSKDLDEKGEPQPRGELWVRGPGVIPGYYKNDQKNKETFTPDGWLMSGDIAMICGKERRLKIIDRKKNIFKLAQGEYIAPEKLENLYKLAHPEIAGLFVHGDSFQSYLVAVANIELPSVVKLATEFGLDPSNPEEVAQSDAFKKRVIGLFDSAAAHHKLNSLEKIKAIFVETRPWNTVDLLTAAFKLKRFDAREFYKETIIKLYANDASK
jgi:long-chain acyl-CoA synthetase